MKRVLIIGSGISGLTCAVETAMAGNCAVLVSPYPSERAQSVMAADGINAVVPDGNSGDSIDLHVRETLDGGCIVAAVFSDCKYGHIIIRLLSGLSLFILWLAASYLLLLYGGNLSLLMLIVYLFVTIYLT